MAVMERPRWTDERIEERFDRVDTDIRVLRAEMKEGFAGMDKRFDQFEKRFEQIDKRFERVDDRFVSMQSEMNLRFEAVQRNMTFWFVSLFSTIIAAMIAFH